MEVIEALLEEGIIISNVIPLSFDAETSGVAGVTGDADVAAADKGKAIEDDGTKATSAAGMVGTAVVKNEDVSDSAAVLPPGGDAARVDRVAGVFHPSVLVENATRLDECYWIRVSEQGLEGEGGGIRILDEAFVLTPSLRWVRSTGRAACAPIVSGTLHYRCIITASLTCPVIIVAVLARIRKS